MGITKTRKKPKAKVKKITTPKTHKMTINDAFLEIVAWLYVNDGNMPNKNAWREALLDHIKFVLKQLK